MPTGNRLLWLGPVSFRSSINRSLLLFHLFPNHRSGSTVRVRDRSLSVAVVRSNGPHQLLCWRLGQRGDKTTAAVNVFVFAWEKVEWDKQRKYVDYHIILWSGVSTSAAHERSMIYWTKWSIVRIFKSNGLSFWWRWVLNRLKGFSRNPKLIISSLRCLDS